MQLTLLELVQDMLTATDSEAVSSVGDTEEAGMCVNIANRAFEYMTHKIKWRHFKQLGSLTSATNLNEMTVPSGTISIDPEFVYYDGEIIMYMEPEVFLAITITRLTSESNITTSNGVKVYSDRNPSYFTSFDDETLVFDAYPAGGLVTNAASVIVWITPTSRLTADAEVFDLPSQAFPALCAKCLSLALNEIKGDTQGSTVAGNDHSRLMASLGRNARLVDSRDDLRKHIVPRPSLRNTTSNIRRTSS